ncbi:TetR/AcrR family transcriptional regulator [Martelella endophytica]|uniref:TetR/AcrR family transcriptional regulator n=1 Tax=Martelella endophytica TaxID=1486262 RepID=UPI000698442E|nr:TetR/AcrR family transcriptional regulator [Martelella endophytica]
MTKSETRTLKILVAAQAEFLESGLRGATMQSIARRAGVAKPTLYAYFPDKEAVFQATLRNIMSRMVTEAEAILSGPGSAVDRAAEALAGKYVYVRGMLAHSPHAQELLDGTKSVGGELHGEVSALLSARIATLLVDEGWPEHAAKHRSELLLDCISGLYQNHAASRTAPEDVAFLARRLLTSP